MNASPSETPPLATSELIDRCMGNAAIARLMLEKFEKQLLEDLGKIEQLLADKDQAQTARVAHALKGAAGAVAAGALHEATAAFEALVKQGQLDLAAQAFPRVRSEGQRCAAYLPQARAAL